MQRGRELRGFTLEEREQAADSEVEGDGVVAVVAPGARAEQHGGGRAVEAPARLGGQRRGGAA